MSFTALGIIEPIVRALERQNYVTPTPIQEQAIPIVLQAHDIIGIAQTGTGKTAAFTIPILQHLYEDKTRKTQPYAPHALILSPTRELAMQITESFKIYGANLGLSHTAVYGGVDITPQIRTLQRGVDILIATPGRLVDLMNQRKVDLSHVKFFVLDEADRMLDMGFLGDVQKIASTLPRQRQSLFFSATMSHAIENLTRDFLKDPQRVEVTPQSTPVEMIDQCIFFIDQADKNELLLDLINQEKMDRTLVFVGMKHKADRVARILMQNGVSAQAIHGNKTQAQRTRALQSFKSGRSRVLVATDVAARGIDIQNISHVINYDMPNEPENYIHRIGRTARAGKAGTAYSFCSASDKHYLNQIERTTNQRIDIAEHKYHSAQAEKAEGADAQPRPRGGGRSTGGRSSQSRNSRAQRGSNTPRKRYNGPQNERFRKATREDSRSGRVRMGRTSSRGSSSSSSSSSSQGRYGRGRSPGSQGRGRGRTGSRSSSARRSSGGPRSRSRY